MRKLIIVLLVLASACSIEKRGAPGTDPTAEVVVGGQSQADSIEVIISSPTYAKLGDAVPIGVVVRNNTDRRIDLHLTGRETVFDIFIERADSSLVWRRLANTAVQQILQLKPLAAGASFTLSDHWRPAEPGEFMVRAELPTDGTPLRSDPVRIVIR
jgi:hypothetical protein